MTVAKRTTKRETAATSRESGKWRNVIVIVEPNGMVGFKLKGLRRVEWLHADVCYLLAIKARIRAEEKAKANKKK